MGDDDAAAATSAQIAIDFQLSFGIEGAGGFIED